MKEEKDKWTDFFWLVPFWYVPTGFLFYHWSKDDSIPVWGWSVAYVLSPLITAGLGLIGYGILFFGFLLLKKCGPIMGKYSDLLDDFETRSRVAAQNGKKWKALGWKVVWVVIAFPILFFLISFAMQER